MSKARELSELGDKITVDGSGNSTFDGDVSAANLSTTGNVTVSGTVDGRDVAADGTKLDGIAAGAEVNTVDSVNTQTGAVVLDADDISDAATTNKFTTAADISKLAGIEAGATADQTASEILTAIKTVDGAGSGLDADTLDGQQGSYYLDGNNFVNLPAGYSGWTVSDGTNSENIADSNTVTFTGSGATSVSYNTTTNTMSISSTDTNTTYSAGGGLSLSGTTFSHSDTSGQGSVNNSGATVIQDVTLDTYGHVTALGSKTITAADIGAVGYNTSTSETGYFALPAGTTAQRPSSPQDGWSRYNTSIGSFEVYSDGAWLPMSTRPTINSISGTIYKDTASTLTISLTDATPTINVIYKTTGGTTLSTQSANVSNQVASPSVPSAVYGQASGTTIVISVQNVDGANSTNSVNKTVTALPTGGTISVSGGYRYHRFTSSGTFNSSGTSITSLDLLIVAGGGGGGQNGGGGGGAGGVIYQTGVSKAAGSYGITIGGGGSRGNNNGDAGYQGGNTTGFGYTAIGGGGGDSRDGDSPTSGGSGGGGCSGSGGASGTSGQGNNGGSSAGGDCPATGGGGGGKTQVGDYGNNNDPGVGGNGGTFLGYAVGGGGAGGFTCNSGGSRSGGSGGGGNTGSAGSTNTGGGGGGHNDNTGSSNNGGSGVVVVRYAL